MTTPNVRRSKKFNVILNFNAKQTNSHTNRRQLDRVISQPTLNMDFIEDPYNDANLVVDHKKTSIAHFNQMKQSNTTSEKMYAIPTTTS